MKSDMEAYRVSFNSKFIYNSMESWAAATKSVKNVRYNEYTTYCMYQSNPAHMESAN